MCFGVTRFDETVRTPKAFHARVAGVTPDETKRERSTLEEPGTRGEHINRKGPAHKTEEDETSDPDVDLYTSAEAGETDEES